MALRGEQIRPDDRQSRRPVVDYLDQHATREGRDDDGDRPVRDARISVLDRIRDQLGD
jgi:hypothetical protein